MLAREDFDLRLVDMGRVEETEMHRLALFHEEDITKFKVKQAKLRVAAINPTVQVKSFHEELTKQNVFLLEGDVLVDTTQDDTLNVIIAAHAMKKKVPLIVARASGSSANILVLHKAPTAAQLQKARLPPVDKAGVLGPTTSLAASIVVAETIKILLGDRASKLISVDAWDHSCKVTKL
jgi:molybdopterin/thiamine biosynthesis adenylyltransferase